MASQTLKSVENAPAAEINQPPTGAEEKLPPQEAEEYMPAHGTESKTPPVSTGSSGRSESKSSCDGICDGSVSSCEFCETCSTTVW